VIPTVITQALAGRESINLGSLHPTRDLNFVEDTAEGFIRLAECDKAIGRAVNIANGKEISIGDLAAKIIKATGSKATIITDDQRIRPAASEVERLMGDTALLASLTGWTPGISLEEGLARTVEWFRRDDTLALYKSDIYNV
jgi:nucleoside-diphosphate-sugar epimerase